MTESTHGHEVLHMILASEAPIPRDDLKAAAAATFGPEARYHTCSARGMDIDGLLSFLLMRGKISETAAGIVAHREEMCQHE